MKTFAFLNMKGGVGKTTTSINVATGLAMKGYKVLLVDFDPQGNTTSMYMDEEPNITISDVLTAKSSIEDAVLEVDDNLDLVPASLELSMTEMDIRMQTNIPQHDRLKKALKKVADKYDFCIIDCPPILNLLTVNTIMTSDLIIIPIKPEKFAVQGYIYTNRNIEQIKEGWDLDVDYKILFTVVNRNNEERAIIEQLRELVGDSVFKTQIRCQPKPIAEASASGEAVIKDMNPKTGVAEDLRNFVDELLEGVE